RSPRTQNHQFRRLLSSHSERTVAMPQLWQLRSHLVQPLPELRLRLAETELPKGTEQLHRRLSNNGLRQQCSCTPSLRANQLNNECFCVHFNAARGFPPALSTPLDSSQFPSIFSLSPNEALLQTVSFLLVAVILSLLAPLCIVLPLARSRTRHWGAFEAS